MVLDEFTKPGVGLSANDNRVTCVRLGRFQRVPDDILDPPLLAECFAACLLTNRQPHDAYETASAWRCNSVAAVPCKILRARSTSSPLPWAITKYLPALA
jgi:hypothetical protein